MDNAVRESAASRPNPFDRDAGADAAADDHTAAELTPLTASLAGRRTTALKLAPLDTGVPANGSDTGNGGHDVLDARAPRTMKSINIGFADLSYTVKVWRYGKWRRGELLRAGESAPIDGKSQTIYYNRVCSIPCCNIVCRSHTVCQKRANSARSLGWGLRQGTSQFARVHG